MKRFQHQQQKAITVRFSISDYLKIEQEAERIGSNLANVLRESWTAYNNSNKFKSDLKQLEGTLLRQSFEVCCAVQGLTPLERKDALDELTTRLNGGAQ
jgi:CMP-N-acetylneuraminic acid synthetase